MSQGQHSRELRRHATTEIESDAEALGLIPSSTTALSHASRRRRDPFSLSPDFMLIN
jgi:hypothetical protein